MTGIVLGSGLGSLADAVSDSREVTFAQAGLPTSTIDGHAGKFVTGMLGRASVMLMIGRVHLYEGHSAQAITAGVRWMKSQGVRQLILTNAAGCLNPKFELNQWMMLSDHLNLTGTSPLMGSEFVDLTHCYDLAWRYQFRSTAAAIGMPLHEGVYAGLRGPQYETPAEIRMLRMLGADAVGMSTVLETIQARALEIPVVAFSFLTNWAAGMSPETLNHHDVLQAGKHSATELVNLLDKVLCESGCPSSTI